MSLQSQDQFPYSRTTSAGLQGRSGKTYRRHHLYWL